MINLTKLLLNKKMQQTPLSTNYITNFDFLNQYLPDTYEKEFERYGNRTISGFLRMVGAEMPTNSDLIKWAEQGRLHTKYTQVGTVDAAGLGNPTFQVNDVLDPTTAQQVIRIGQTVAIVQNNGSGTNKAVVTAVTAPGAGRGSFQVACYEAAGLITAGTGLSNSDVTVFIYGSEFRKGTAGMQGSTEANDFIFENKPIILKDTYTVSGSDMAQIGWVEVATEDGTGGYLWYLKAESETRLRFEDYLEMSMVEGELKTAASPIAGAVGAGIIGTEGLFAAIQARGNVEVGFTAAAGIDSFDAILKNLDTQGAIEENMLFLNRNTALDFDDMLASISGGYAGGTAFGLFENSEEMALNLGFSGFRRGSYDFYKTDWKYLNDASTRGAMTGPASIEGVLVPAGTSTVYDQILGTNIRRPFLHVRYRASQADDRRMKSWLTGSVGGAFTSTLDAMEVNFLSERCLVTQAANNFVLFKGI